MTDCRIIHGDALAVLGTLTERIDAVVTDPPYGVGFKYASYDDSPTGYREWCGRWFQELRRVCDGPICISCGIENICGWPQPNWVLCWHKPAAMGRCHVGFNNWEPVLVYGKTRAGSVVDVFTATINPDPDLRGHPCPKPLEWARSVVLRTTREGDTVLDPFCGSGTTGVVCAMTGRNFIGIEIDERYCDIARRRIAEAAPLFRQQREVDLELFATMTSP